MGCPLENDNRHLAVIVVLFFFTALLYYLFLRQTSRLRLPPGPLGWPIIGNMFQLGSMPPRTLMEMKHKYGPVMWLRIGSINTMVIQSAKTATEFFKNHDITFAERTLTETTRAHDYHKGSLALAPYGNYWRVVRRLITTEMLVNKRLNDTASIRRRCIDDMLLWIEKEARKLGEGRGVQVTRFAFLTSFNLLGNLMLSRDLSNPDSEECSEFFETTVRAMEWSGHANLGDLFPWLRWLDPQGLRRKMERDLGKAMKIAFQMVKERKEERRSKRLAEGESDENRECKDLLDLFLAFRGKRNDEPDKISDKELNILILEIFIAGSETSSSTVEWALTELLCNPESMRKVKSELAQVVRGDEKLEESDIENLPYLQAVIKETLRLHPPIPFLVPRRAMKDTKFMGFDVPKNTQVFVNAWAIGRDEDVWEDPLEFKPERFLGSKIDYKGQHFELIPFGAGRRMCAGVPMAHRMLHLTLGSLLHKFDWKLQENVTPEKIDRRYQLGITMRKLEPLLAVPIPA